MSAGNSDAEDDLEEAFRLDPEFGLTLLHEEFQEMILRRIKATAWSLSAEERLDIYHGYGNDSRQTGPLSSGILHISPCI